MDINLMLQQCPLILQLFFFFFFAETTQHKSFTWKLGMMSSISHYVEC